MDDMITIKMTKKQAESVMYALALIENQTEASDIKSLNESQVMDCNEVRKKIEIKA